MVFKESARSQSPPTGPIHPGWRITRVLVFGAGLAFLGGCHCLSFFSPKKIDFHEERIDSAALSGHRLVRSRHVRAGLLSSGYTSVEKLEIFLPDGRRIYSEKIVSRHQNKVCIPHLIRKKSRTRKGFFIPEGYKSLVFRRRK